MVIIIGIGGSKSILFILLAYCLIGLTIIIILLILLREDLRDCYYIIGIKYIK